ncbi:hypothetical protein D3C83_03190 [compost metagenome]
MHEAQAHPVGHQQRGAAADFTKNLFDTLLPGEKIGRNEFHQLPQRVLFAMRRVDLEIAEAQEGGRDPADHGARFLARMAVVEHVAQHRLAGGGEAERARGGHAEEMHRLAAHEFAHRGAQHRTAVCGARIRRFPRALELEVMAPAFRRHHFAQRDGTPVSQLSRPYAELVPAVAGGVGRHAREHAVAAEDLDGGSRGRVRARDAQHLSDRLRPTEEFWRSHRRRIDARVAGVAHRA